MPDPQHADVITLSYDWDREEFLEFHGRFIRYPPNRLVYWMMIAVVLLLTVRVTRMTYSLWQHDSLAPFWPDIAGFYLFITCFLVFWVWGLRRLNVWIQSRWVSRQRHITLDRARGVSRSAGSRTKTVEWRKVARVTETDDLFVVFHTFNEGFYVPKRAFISAEQIGRFRRLVEEKGF